MLERDIEVKMKSFVEQQGGQFLKLSVPGNNAIPDRLLLMPGGKAAFVELKAPGKKPRRDQVYYHKQLRRDGFDVHVVDDIHQAEKVVQLYAGD